MVQVDFWIEEIDNFELTNAKQYVSLQPNLWDSGGFGLDILSFFLIASSIFQSSHQKYHHKSRSYFSSVQNIKNPWNF